MTRRMARPRSAGFAGQRGAALMMMMLIMVLGTAWAVLNAVTQASRNTVKAQVQTGDSLKLAKIALLGFAAQDALTSDVPGRFPCPEDTSSIGGANEGKEASSCGTLPAIGRLPWKTLGIDKPLDGAGEALWYVVSSGVRTAPINFSTTGALTLDSTANAAVAFVIAPGAALNTVSESGTAPSPCVKRNQITGRNVAPLNSSDFVECGNATMTAFESSRNDTWGNDRVIAITAAEMLSAIEGPVADRIQRNVTPALNGLSASTGWYWIDSLNEWGTKFLPYASSWGDPTADDSCGDYGVTEGLLPLATGSVAVGSPCSSRWTSGTATQVGGTGSITPEPTICAANPATNPTRMRCPFTYIGAPIIQVTVTAPNIAMGFRTAPTAAQITFTPTGSSLTSRTPSIVPASGNGQLVLVVKMANRTSSGNGRIFVPYPSDSILVNTNTTSNPDLAWFINNQWNRYTYYAISPAAAASPSGTCTSVDVTNCLSLTNAVTGTGNINDKRITLILSGRALTGKTQPSSNLSDYFEAQNDQTSTSGDRTFQRDTISTTFNDRPGVCPFQLQTTGSAIVLCD